MSEIVSSETLGESLTEAEPARAAEPGLARSAGILGLGNVASRVFGLARDTIISGFFGSSGALSAFNLAMRVPNLVYDLLVGGMLSAALVPVFSDYARPERRHELARLASAVLSMFAVVMGAFVLLIELFAEPAAGLLGNFADPALQAELARSLRLIAPAILFFGLSGGVTGLLYALKRFSYTAASVAVFNLGIVILAPLLAHRLSISVLPLGIVAGSVAQLAVMAPGLRDVRLHLSLAWNHPGVHRILRLYVPIAAGLIIGEIQVIVDGRWASATGAQSVAWMRYATTLIQLPLGLVPVAVSLAALPSLSQRAAAGDWEDFQRIFGRGLRLVLVLLLPAAAGLWALAAPVIRLLFEHGRFLPQDTAMTVVALRLYLLGLLFAGVDFLLNYTFYARQDTRTPAIVGIVAVGIYFVSALSLMPRFGFLGLVLADSIKQAGHATIMTVLLLQTGGRPHGQRIRQTFVRAAGVSLLMGCGVWLLAQRLTLVLPAGLIGKLTVVVLAGGLGSAFYVWALGRLGVPEVNDLARYVAVRTRLRGRAA